MTGRHAKSDREKRPAEAEELAAWAARLIGHHDVVTGETTGLLARCREDPANLVLVQELRDRIGDIYMMGFALASRYADEGGDYGHADIARLMGLKRPTAFQNSKKGERLLDEVREKLGVKVLRKKRTDALVKAKLRRAKVVPLRKADTA